MSGAPGPSGSLTATRPSSPTVAMSPWALTDTIMQCASCAPTSRRNTPSAADHKVARPSSETQISRLPSGSQATELMSSVCRASTVSSTPEPSSPTRHTATVLSADAVASTSASTGFQAQALTRRRWRSLASSVGRDGSPVSQTITVPSYEQLASRFPSGLKPTWVSGAKWPGPQAGRSMGRTPSRPFFIVFPNMGS